MEAEGAINQENGIEEQMQQDNRGGDPEQVTQSGRVARRRRWLDDFETVLNGVFMGAATG